MFGGSGLQGLSGYGVVGRRAFLGVAAIRDWASLVRSQIEGDP